MEHQMKLYESPFDRIKSGKKRIEIRLFDEKRQGVNLGDIIHFSKLPDLNERLSTEVIGLLRYKSFQDLVDDFPMSAFGYPDDYDKRAFVQECYEVYTPEEEKKFGVLGIRIKLL
jgi:ASC-1-like (ASCH) protein